MAFFRASNGARYFTCYYSQSKHGFSGTFYTLTDRSAYNLSRIYQITTILSVVILILELAVPVLIGNLNPDQRSILLASFFIVDALVMVPAALVIVNRKKIVIRDQMLYVDKRESMYVYFTVALVPLNYTIMMIWLTVYDDPSRYLPVMILLTLVAICGAVYRVRQILTDM